MPPPWAGNISLKTASSSAQTNTKASSTAASAAPRASFTYSPAQFQELVDDVLQQARKLGASDAAAEVSEGMGLSVSVRRGELENVERNRDKSLGVTLYMGQRRGHASTSDFSPAAIKQTVRAAFDIARFTADDPVAGLPEAEDLATEAEAGRDLQLYHPWSVDAAQAAEIALRAEAAAFAVSRRISNSDGAGVSAQQSHFWAGNTRGFKGGYASSRHSVSVAPIAGRGKHMQRDAWYSSMRDALDLADPELVGRYAAQRALSRLGARRVPTATVPVLFEAPVAAGLLGSFVQAVSGAALYRKASFLTDSLGQQVMAKHLDVLEDPHVLKGKGSAPFDDEGVRTIARNVVQAGVLQGYFLSSYSARKLGMRTTGHAGGSHNLQLRSRRTRPGDDLDAMIKRLHRGLFVTELMGQGVNGVTGDYSRGASGFWIENGQIAFPVEEITIAGNLRQMLRRIAAVGADTYTLGSKTVGSVIVEGMRLAGS
jgi:PmbA protein